MAIFQEYANVLEELVDFQHLGFAVQTLINFLHDLGTEAAPAEELILKFGICSYPDLLDFAFSMFEYKELSTLKSKCRAVFKWMVKAFRRK